MKTGRSGAGDRRKIPAGPDAGSDSQTWEQQVDYPVVPDGDAKSAGVDPGMMEGLSREERIRLIAYLRAEKRGFNGGDEMEDWLEAEREVDGGEPTHETDERR